MSDLGSYSKIYALGHRATAPLFSGPVVVEEKVDGSQFSFGKSEDGRLYARSKRCPYDLDAGVWDRMFEAGCLAVIERRACLVPGWTYRGEYLNKPKHNTLEYQRIPDNHIVIFDIDTGNQDYLSWDDKCSAANEIGLECIPKLAEGEFFDWEHLKELLDRDSFLGGAKIEGFVVKNYAKFDQTSGKTLMGKFVSEAFKEKHIAGWAKDNPKRDDLINTIAGELRSEVRWRKAVEHLRDAGELEQDPRDIGKLIKEIQDDITEDESEAIAVRLFEHFRRRIMKGALAGFPEWYKEHIAAGAFTNAE